MNILLTALFPVWYPLMCDGTLGSMVLFCSCLLSESIWQQTNYLKQSVWALSVFWSTESCKYQINIVFLLSCVLENGPVSQSISHLYTGIYSDASPHPLQAFFYFKCFKYWEGSAFCRMSFFLVVYKAFGVTICMLNPTTHGSICIFY